MSFAYDVLGPIKRVIIDWTSDNTTGAVSGTTKKITGELIKAVTNPGSTAPTDNYDIAITDEESADVLANCVAAGRLDNRDTSNTETAYFFVENLDASPVAESVHPVVCDVLTIAVTNAGNSKVGRLILYVRGEIA